MKSGLKRSRMNNNNNNNHNHNYNKILKSDWLSTALISAFITSTLKSLAIRAI